MEQVADFRRRSVIYSAFILLLSVVLVLVLNKQALSCDIAVISAKASATGRPIIWKNFDCSAFFPQQLKYFPAQNSKAGGYYVLYHNEDYMQQLTGSPIMPQSCVNEAGFAISCTAVYESNNLAHEAVNLNTGLMLDAVANCATLADFEAFVAEWPKTHYNRAISANYVVIDAKGGAALYEMYTGADTTGYMPIMWKKYDANTGEVVDNTGQVIQAAQSNFVGYVHRTNFNSYINVLNGYAGYDRWVRGQELLANLAQNKSLSPENIMRVVSKDVNGKQLAASSSETNYSTTYCISRSATRSGTVVEGVAPGGDPRITTYWVALGEPSISVYVPTFTGAKSVSPYLYMDTINADGTMSDNSDTSLLNLAEDYRETYNKLIYESNRGNVLTGMEDKTINKVELAKVQKWTFAIEDKVFEKTRAFVNALQADPSLITAKNLKNYGDYVAKYVYDNYTAASATAVPWTFTIPTAKDTTPPTAQISYSTTQTTDQPVVATLVNESEPITVTNNGGSRQYTFTENGSFTFEFKDAAGNVGTATATVTWIIKTPQNTDTTPPTAQISYSTTSATNQNVVATLVNESEPITVTNNGGSRQYTFTQNGSFTFEFKDAAGNVGTATATVNWIDKTPPTAQISYSTTQTTDQPVVATLISESEPITVTNNGGSRQYTFTENGSFTFEFKDAAGNVGTATATVTWIIKTPQNTDTTPPTAQISYSTTSATNQNVVATLVNESEPITVTNNGGSRQYTFTQNGSFTFEFKDAAGNVGTATATVNWIDKEAPVGTITYRRVPFVGVIATLTTNEPVTILNNYGRNTYLFRRNGSFTFMFKDAAGNIGTATATVNWPFF